MSGEATPRAFAKIGSARFLFDPEHPEHLYAQEECASIDQRIYWHSAGKVAMRDARRAQAAGIQLQWISTGNTSCWHSGRHSVRVTAEDLGRILVALDQAIEAGMPKRGAREVSALLGGAR